MIEVILIICIALVFTIILRRVSQVKLDSADTNLALHAQAMTDTLENHQVSSGVGIDVKLDIHINNLIRQAEKAIKQQKYSYAEKVLIRIATLDPSNTQTYTMLGELYFKTNNYKDAAAAFREALKRDPKNADILNNLGLAYYNLKRYRKSIPFFLKSLRIDGSVAHRFVSLASSYQAIENNKKAKIYFKKALELEPQNIAYKKMYQEVE